jgi:proteasome lid subunit RPN8/RPN11
MEILTDNVKATIKLHAQKQAPLECCGVIIHSLNGLVAFPCRNIHSEPEKFFTLKPEDYLEYSMIGKIVGYYHSHQTNEDFSEFDKLNSENHKLVAVLYVVKPDVFHIYTPKGYEVPYCKREYIHGVVDCFSLVKDYYARELNIQLTDITHPYRYVENKVEHPDNQMVHTILKEHFVNNGFVEVQAAAKHDVILQKTPHIPSPVHCAIFLGNNQLLHHPFKKRSCIDTYSNVQRTRTKHIMRHTSRI